MNYLDAYLRISLLANNLLLQYNELRSTCIYRIAMNDYCASLYGTLPKRFECVLSNNGKYSSLNDTKYKSSLGMCKNYANVAAQWTYLYSLCGTNAHE